MHVWLFNNIKSYIDLVYNPKNDIHIWTNVFLKAIYMYTHFGQLEHIYTFSKKKDSVLFCFIVKMIKKVVKGSRKLMQPITDVTYKENIQLYKQKLTYWRKPTAMNIMTVFVRTITFRKTLWSIKWKGAFFFTISSMMPLTASCTKDISFRMHLIQRWFNYFYSNNSLENFTNV